MHSQSLGGLRICVNFYICILWVCFVWLSHPASLDRLRVHQTVLRGGVFLARKIWSQKLFSCTIVEPQKLTNKKLKIIKVKASIIFIDIYMIRIPVKNTLKWHYCKIRYRIGYLKPLLFNGKSLLDPPNYWGVSTLPPKLWNGLIYSLNFAKPAKSPPRAVLSGGFATVTAVLLQ
jgi:hypothetical protein